MLCIPCVKSIGAALVRLEFREVMIQDILLDLSSG